MSAQIKDGGPAFPVPDSNSQGHVECSYVGMTLLDYFAAKAMQALIAEPVNDGQRGCCWIVNGRPCEDDEQFPAFFAEAAYRFADAMLRWR